MFLGLRLSFCKNIKGMATLAVCQPVCARHTGVACLAIFNYFLTLGVQNCSSPSVSLSPSIAKTLLSLFATVISPSRRLLRNAVSLQLWNGSYAIGMHVSCVFSCLFCGHLCYAFRTPLNREGALVLRTLARPDRALIQVSEL